VYNDRRNKDVFRCQLCLRDQIPNQVDKCYDGKQNIEKVTCEKFSRILIRKKPKGFVLFIEHKQFSI